MITNNIFYCENKWKTELIFDLPPYASFYDMYADGNRFFVKNGMKSEKKYRIMDEKCDYNTMLSYLEDNNAEYLREDPFKNGGTSTVGFADSASVSGGRIPMKLSKPVNEECNVYYTVWDYDSGSVLREGTLHFDRFETEKCIYAGENENNILIEISGVQNIARGKICFHYLKQD